MQTIDIIIIICSSVTFYAKLVFQSFKFKSIGTERVLIRAIYKYLIRPKLEYANVIWSPTLEKHTKMLESVQHPCTKFGSLATLSYHDRLVQLGLTTLESRCNRGDLIQMYKYVKGIDKIQFVNPRCSVCYNITKSHGFQFEGDKVSMLRKAKRGLFPL